MIRLALFLAALAAAFAGAAGIGRAVGPLERGEERGHGDARPAMPGHASAGTGATSGVAGLALASGPFRLVPAETRLRTGPARFGFRIAGADRFELVHERRMHLIVVRRDLTDFRHVHPRRRADGSWVAALDLREPGVYRAFADFSSGGRRTVLGIDLFADGPSAGGSTDGPRGQVTMEREPGAVEFDVSPEPLPYLGARGHLVVLREGDLAYVHAHPRGDSLRFELDLPTPGSYRAFLQYRTRDGLRTATFALEER